MDLGLDGKIVLIGGASSGMGRASALAAAAEGARVVAVARRETELSQLVKECSESRGNPAMGIVADLATPDAAATVVAETLTKVGRPDAVINTVGLCEPVPGAILDQDESYWERAFQSVLMANVRMCKAVIPEMREAGKGAIVNVSAMSANFHLPILAHYSAMKVALAHFTKNLAREFAPVGIRSNAVMPGMIESEYVLEKHIATAKETGQSFEELFEQTNRKYHELTFSKRFGRPDEIADAAIFLISDRASYINGAMLNVDGGSEF